MSNIRLNTIVPDVINNPEGVISLPGSLSIDTSTSTLDTTTSNASIICGGVGIGQRILIGENIIFGGSASSSYISQNTVSGYDNKSSISR